MLILISPAKTLDFDTPSVAPKHSQAGMLDDSEQLIDILTTKSPLDLEKMMGISSKLAQLNAERYHQWSRPFNNKNAKQALLAFKGDVYTGLNAETFSEADFLYAQEHLRILSGLYGVLRPLDLIQPYRLEMGIKLENSRGKNLYEFWGERITKKLNSQLKKIESDTILNLASNEYFKSVKHKELNGKLVTPVFKDWKNGQYKMISFFAKKARGTMSAWLIQQQVEDLAKLKRFKIDGYKYSAAESSPEKPVFLRKA